VARAQEDAEALRAAPQHLHRVFQACGASFAQRSLSFVSFLFIERGRVLACTACSWMQSLGSSLGAVLGVFITHPRVFRNPS
jgi:hypothetical protein